VALVLTGPGSRPAGADGMMNRADQLAAIHRLVEIGKNLHLTHGVKK